MIAEFESKIVTPEDLEAATASLPRPVVFTNGVFDILHRGHATYLAQARAMGASLVVAINSDPSVRRLGKGDDRPINPLDDRLSMLAALGSTTLVSWFEEDTPIEAIKAVRPDVLVKGGDWPVETMVGAREVLSWGGKVESVPFEHDRSTTSLLKRVRQSQGR